MELIAVITIFLVGAASAVDDSFSYAAQDQWTGICVSGNQMRQSPINIVTSDVQDMDSLIDLQLTSWDTEVDGVFENLGGHTVQFNFDSDTPGTATTRNHLGTYTVLQFHMHWGNRTGTGSEHTVDGDQTELEIHFVQVKQGETDRSARDYLSVIGVLADVDTNAPISGVWAKLNAAAVQPYNGNTTIEDLSFNDFLPENLAYWFYEGGLTTPPCSEIVAWFVLKERITVPGAFLDLLRGVEETADGRIFTFNYRMIQQIGNRNVYDSGAPSIQATPIILLLALAMLLANFM